MNSSRTSASIPRRGIILVVALVTLLLAMAMTVSLLKSTVVERGQVEQQLRQLQAETLADAALDRAAAKLRTDPAYTEEQWQPVSSAHAEPIGSVLIVVDSSGDGAGANGAAFRITCTADIPDDAGQRVRVVRTYLANTQR